MNEKLPVLYVGPECPASFLRTHPDAALVLTAEVAQRPQIALR